MCLLEQHLVFTSLPGSPRCLVRKVEVLLLLWQKLVWKSGNGVSYQAPGWEPELAICP